MARGISSQLTGWLPGALPGLLSSAAQALDARGGIRAASYLARTWMDDGSCATSEIPAPRLSLGLATKVAADEAFRTLMVALANVPSRDGLCAVRDELAQACDLYERNGWLDDARGYHQTPPALTSPRVSHAHSWGIDFDHLQFVSGYEPHAADPGRDRWMSYKPCQSGHAWVLRHRGKPRPWLVCVHGYRMGFPLADFHAFGVERLHDELGFNIVMPTLPLHGDRAIGVTSGDGFFTSQFMDTVHAEAQAIWDLRRILEWVRGQEPVSIGVYGISLGAYSTALLAGFEHDLDCVIAGMPMVCLPTLLAEHAPRRLWRTAERVGLGIDDVIRALRVVSPLALQPRTSPDRLNIYGALADRLVPSSHLNSLWEHWRRPSLEWFEGTHLSFAWESAVDELVLRALSRSGMLEASRASGTPLDEAA